MIRNTLQKKASAILFAAMICSMLLAANAHHALAQWWQDEPYSVIIEPSDIEVNVGDEVAFEAYLEDTTGTRIDTTFTWSIIGNKTGSISEDGVFLALRSGEATVVATFNRVSGYAQVMIVDEELPLNEWNVVISPAESTIVIGETIEFSAYLQDTTGAVKDTIFDWSVSNEVVGAIDSDGIFTGVERGHTFVYATAGDLEGRAYVNVCRDVTPIPKEFEVIVQPHDTCVTINQQVQFTAALVDSQGNEIDTVFSWSIDNNEIGSISETGLFEATVLGSAFIYATVGEITGRGRVVVRDTCSCDSSQTQDGWNRLEILPQDTLLLVGDQVQFQAFWVDSSGVWTDTIAAWSTLGRNVGTIDENGLFTATNKGTGLIRARLNNRQATTRVLVTTAEDTVGADSVRFHFRQCSGEQVGNVHRIREMGTFKISGLPFPLNILNGGEIILPAGSLSEDISIDISLPTAAIIEGDTSVSFIEGIIAGISFNVYVNDTLVSPYYFDEPVHITLPYKEELMERLGIAPDDLWIFFYTEDATLDSSGIFNVVVDTTENKIYVEVSHFSEIVAADLTTAFSTGLNLVQHVPDNYRLDNNYPNPFNPETEIAFSLPGKAYHTISLKIYNLLGQEVKMLFDGALEGGNHTIRWDGRDNAGKQLVSGVYIYQLKSENITLSKKMLLVR